MALTIKSSKGSGHSKEDVARSVSELIRNSPDDLTSIMIIKLEKSGDFYVETVTTELWDAIGTRNLSDVPQRILTDLLQATLSQPVVVSVDGEVELVGYSEEKLVADLVKYGVRKE